MSLEKVAVKNERSGTTLVIGEPSLRPTERNSDVSEPTEVLAADKHEERAPAKV